jgi:hypothetical protein
MVDSVPSPDSVTAVGPRSVAVGRDVLGPVFTGDVYVGGYERFEDVRQYADGLVAELDLSHFTGRRWLVDDIDEFLRSEDRGYFVLEAGAGVGKTTFCAWLAHSRGYPQHLVQIPGGADAAAAVKNLAAQVIDAYQLDEIAPGGVLPPAAARPDWFVRVLAAAGKRARQAARPLVLVVDGLDQVPHRVGDMPLGLPPSPPPGVYLVVSRRPGGQLLPIEAPRRYFTLQPWAEPNQAPVPNQQDMVAYLRRVADESPLSELLAAADLAVEVFVDQVAAKCAGVWIYLRYVMEEMRHLRRSVTDLTALPETLWQYYARTFARDQHDDPARWNAVLLPLLTTLGAVGEPVTFDLLCTLAGVEADDRWRRVLDGSWRPFLQVQDDGLDVEPRYAVYHASLREFLDGRLTEEALAQMSAERPLIRQLHQALRERHSRIGDRYLSAWGGLATDVSGLRAPTAGDLDDGYGLRHLASHLLAAGRSRDLHRLLACQWTQPSVDPALSPRLINAWFTARDRSGDLVSYLKDVELAWQAAATATRQELSSGGADVALGLELRYALITASIVSLASTVPIPLIAALTEHRLWAPAQALAYSRQLPDPAQRASALIALHPFARPDQQHPAMSDALTAARQITDRHRRAQVLAALAPLLRAEQQRQVWAESLAAVRHLTDKDRRAREVAKESEVTPTDQREQSLAAFNAAKLIAKSDEYHARLLATLTPQLPADLLGEALAAAWQIADESARVRAVAALAPRLPADLLAQTLAAAQQINDEDSKARLLATLTPQLPADLLGEALAAAWQIADEYLQVQAVAALAPRLPADLLADELAAARQIGSEIPRAQLLAALTPLLPADQQQPVWAAALTAARQISNYTLRVLLLEVAAPQMLTALAPLLSADLLADVLAAARQNSDEFLRAQELAALASRLPPEQQQQVWAEALDAARQITREVPRAHVLAALAPVLSAELLAELLAAVRQISDEILRARGLAALAPRLPPEQQQHVWAEALVAAQQVIRDDPEGLAMLVPQLPVDLLAEALATARQISEEYPRMGVAFLGPNPELPADLVDELMLEFCREFADASKLTQMLMGLAMARQFGDDNQINEINEQFVDMLDEAVPASRKLTRYQFSRADVLAALAPRLPTDLLVEALTDTRQISDKDRRARVIAALVPRLPASLLADALTAAQQIGDEYPRAQLLAALASCLPADLLDETLAAARQITDTAQRTKVLATLASHLSADQQKLVWAEALAAAQQINSEYFRAQELALLAPQLPADLIAETLAAARQIRQEDTRAQLLATLAPRLPTEQQQDEVWAEALAAADGADLHGFGRAQLLAALVAQMPTDIVDEELANARQVSNAPRRTEWLAALAPRLPTEQQREEVWAEALTAARQSTDDYERAYMLEVLAPRLPAGLLAEALAAARQISDVDSRAQLLIGLAPRLPAGLLAEALAAARQISDEDCRVRVLAALAPRLPAGLFAEALAAARQISDERERARALAALAGQMAAQAPLSDGALLQEVLPVLARHPRHELVADLRILLAHPQGTALGTQIASITAEATIAVGNWWP